MQHVLVSTNISIMKSFIKNILFLVGSIRSIGSIDGSSQIRLNTNERSIKECRSILKEFWYGGGMYLRFKLSRERYKRYNSSIETVTAYPSLTRVYCF